MWNRTHQARFSGGLLSGGLPSHPTDFGAVHALIRMDSLGVTVRLSGGLLSGLSGGLLFGGLLSHPTDFGAGNALSCPRKHIEDPNAVRVV